MAVVVNHMDLPADLQNDVKRSDEMKQRLSKRLTYLLRYGALKEGLHVHPGGYVDLEELLKVTLLRRNTRAEVVKQIETSMSYRNTPRFEEKREDGRVFVRATHGCHLQRNPCHENSRVKRLLVTCMSTVSRNVELYEFDSFPDQFLLNALLHKMKREKRLSNPALRHILSSSFEHLDLEGVYLTEGSIRIITSCCPNLKVLNLRGLGFLLNDHYMEMLVKKLPKLESLNLSGCHHLTDRTLDALGKHCKNLQHLNASGIPGFTQPGIIDLVLSCPRLQHLDIYENGHIKKSGRDKLLEIAATRDLVVVLRGLDDELVAPKDPSMVLPVWKTSIPTGVI